MVACSFGASRSHCVPGLVVFFGGHRSHLNPSIGVVLPIPMFVSPVRSSDVVVDGIVAASTPFSAWTTPRAARAGSADGDPGSPPPESPFDGPPGTVLLPPWASPDSSAVDGEYARRGRPRANMIKSLIDKGTFVESAIRCKTCNRVFPRDKSLQAHMRTHTGKI